MRILGVLLLVYALTAGGVRPAVAQQITNGSAAVIDGVVTLQGTFNELGGIQVESAGEFLSLETASGPGLPPDLPLRTPFPEDGLVVENGPGRIILGVLGSENQIDISGTTATAVLYSQSQSTAAAGDMTVKVGGDCGPLTIPIGREVTATCGRRGWQIGNPDGGGSGDGGDGNQNGGDPPGGGNPDGGNESNAFQLIDGEIHLVGDFQDLSGIEIISSDGGLSLGTIDLGFKAVDPFPEGIVVTDTPNISTIGTLGAQRAIDISGTTKTAILYSESLETAKSDLSILIGADKDTTPQNIPVGSAAEISGRGITIEDGVLSMVGTYSDFAAIEATSLGGYLSIDEFGIEGSTLFSAFDNNISRNEENLISITSSNSVTHEGLTPTGIFFDGDSEAFAAAGIQVLVSLGDTPPIALTNLNIPEPTSSTMFLIATLIGMVGRRRRP